MEWPFTGREPELEQASKLIYSRRGIAILGSAGVGKSRLQDELVGRARTSGLTVFSTGATDGTREIPLAPFVELIPPTPTEDSLALLGHALAGLGDLTGPKGLLVTVDDAHNLDPLSVAFLSRVVSSGAAVVSLTARSGESMDHDLLDLWTDGVIERIDLEPLAEPEMRSLLESVLGKVDEATHDEAWRLSSGNPLVAHELIEGAIGTALQHHEDGSWKLAGPLARSSRLGDLVRSRLVSLPEDIRNRMDLVSIGSPLPIEFATELFKDGLHTLEENGLVSVVDAGGTPNVVPAHPLYGEILRANLGATRLRVALRTLVETAAKSNSELDPLRPAQWQRDLGFVVDPDIALAGAEQALVRHDPILAEELVRSIDTKRPEPSLLLGRALSYQQRFSEAEEVLRSTEFDDPELAGMLASIRAQNLAFGLGRVDEARDLLAQAADQVEDDELEARLNNERAMVSAIRGDFGDATRAANTVLDNKGLGAMPRAAAYATLTVALAMTGDTRRMDEIIAEAITVSQQARNVLPFATDQIRIMEVVSHINAGRIGEANRLAAEMVGQLDADSGLRSTWLGAQFLGLEASGLLRQAIAVAEAALEAHVHADPFGLQPQTLGCLALAKSQTGDGGGAESVESISLPTPSSRLTVWIDRGRAWSTAVHGDIDMAVATLIEGGKSAVGGEHYAWAASCFHDVVRLGHPELVLNHLGDLPTMPAAHLIANLIRHASVMDDRDLAGLGEVAKAFGEMGANLLAAEAWAQLADACELDSPEASRAAMNSMLFEWRCESPETPGLRARPNPISTQEVEIAVDAAGDLTSPQIAEKRFLSPRTVDNHLHSVYRKLGIGGRDELRGLIPTVLDGL